MREEVKEYKCRCVAVLVNDEEERCGQKVTADQPFCGACESRHEDPCSWNRDWKAVTFVPIGADA